MTMTKEKIFGDAVRLILGHIDGIADEDLTTAETQIKEIAENAIIAADRLEKRTKNAKCICKKSSIYIARGCKAKVHTGLD